MNKLVFAASLLALVSTPTFAQGGRTQDEDVKNILTYIAQTRVPLEVTLRDDLGTAKAYRRGEDLVVQVKTDINYIVGQDEVSATVRGVVPRKVRKACEITYTISPNERMAGSHITCPGMTDASANEVDDGDQFALYIAVLLEIGDRVAKELKLE